MYDIIIIGGGAAGLFCSIFLPKDKKSAILEKTSKLGTKVLLSGGGRCNFSNTNIAPINDYFGQDKRMLPSLFYAFGSDDMVNILEKHGIQTNQEENGRLILRNGKAYELNNFLIQKSIENNTEHITNQNILEIKKQDNIFVITTTTDIFETKNLIIATGGKSFPQIGATDFGIQIAKQFGIKTTEMMPGLCGIETKQDVSILTGNSCLGTAKLLYQQKEIYQETGNILFTHRGISGPIIFNTSNAIGEYCIKKGISDLNNFYIKINLDQETTIKKIINHFGISESNQEIILNVKKLRPREEAKVTVGGISMQEIKPNMETKKNPGLYFIGELLDITGKTGGYNLQRCWTSAHACAKSFKKTKNILQ